MITVSDQAGRIAVTLAVQQMGKDVNVSLYGGDVPHIGAVALAQPRESLKGDGKIAASCSVLTLCGHKEDELAKYVAVTLAKRLRANVCVACGIHVEEITEQEIGVVFEIVNRLLDDPRLA